MTQSPPIVGLLTDFGEDDGYVGAMKGVILKECGTAQLIDVTHLIAPQDVRSGAFILRQVVPSFPDGTIFLAVVDPGVGSSRSLLYAEAGPYRFVAPDNGLLSWAMSAAGVKKLIRLEPEKIGVGEVSSTFHARDIMGPAVGKLLAGADPTSWGEPVEEYAQIEEPRVQKIGSMWTGEILAVDRFGNLISNLPGGEVDRMKTQAKLWFDLDRTGASVRGLAASYSDLPADRVGALVGSHGYVEFAVRNGSAARLTGMRSGARVSLHLRV